MVESNDTEVNLGDAAATMRDISIALQDDAFLLVFLDNWSRIQDSSAHN